MRLGEKETREGKRREDKRGAQVGKSKMRAPVEIEL